MKIFFYIVCTLSLISLFACVQPVEPKTKTYEIPVPEEKQIYSNWCVPASVLMCAEYFANDVGWSDYSFPYLTTEEKEKIIYLILKRFGETFGSLRMIRENIIYKKRPLISIVSESTDKTHAVVVRGVQETADGNEVKQIYYIDPWYGKRNKSKSEWNRYSLLNNIDYLTMYFDEYN